MLANSVKGQIKDFKQVSQTTFEIRVERDKAYSVTAKVFIPLNYPEAPPIFKLTMHSSGTPNSNHDLPSSLLSKIDMSDLNAVNAMRSQQSLTQPADLLSPFSEPVQPILDQILEELHIFYTDFCSMEQLDWLLSLQIRKLIGCLDIMHEVKVSPEGETLNGLLRHPVTSRWKKLPFAYNQVQNRLDCR